MGQGRGLSLSVSRSEYTSRANPAIARNIPPRVTSKRPEEVTSATEALTHVSSEITITRAGLINLKNAFNMSKRRPGRSGDTSLQIRSDMRLTK